MHLKGPLVATFFIALFALSVLLAGCGGRDESGNGSQNGAGGGAGQNGDSAQKKGAPLETKIGVGRIGRVDEDRERFILRPTAGKQGDRMVFKVHDDTKFTLAGKKAELSDVEKGQQAQIRYVSNDGRNVARAVTLFEIHRAAPKKGEKPEGDETTG